MTGSQPTNLARIADMTCTSVTTRVSNDMSHGLCRICETFVIHPVSSDAITSRVLGVTYRSPHFRWCTVHGKVDNKIISACCSTCRNIDCATISLQQDEVVVLCLALFLEYVKFCMIHFVCTVNLQTRRRSDDIPHYIERSPYLRANQTALQ